MKGRLHLFLSLLFIIFSGCSGCFLYFDEDFKENIKSIEQLIDEEIKRELIGDLATVPLVSDKFIVAILCGKLYIIDKETKGLVCDITLDGQNDKTYFTAYAEGNEIYVLSTTGTLMKIEDCQVVLKHTLGFKGAFIISKLGDMLYVGIIGDSVEGIIGDPDFVEKIIVLSLRDLGVVKEFKGFFFPRPGTINGGIVFFEKIGNSIELMYIYGETKRSILKLGELSSGVDIGLARILQAGNSLYAFFHDKLMKFDENLQLNEQITLKGKLILDPVVLNGKVIYVRWEEGSFWTIVAVDLNTMMELWRIDKDLLLFPRILGGDDQVVVYTYWTEYFGPRMIEGIKPDDGSLLWQIGKYSLRGFSFDNSQLYFLLREEKLISVDIKYGTVSVILQGSDCGK